MLQIQKTCTVCAYVYIYIFMYKASNPGRKFYILSAIDLTIAIM